MSRWGRRITQWEISAQRMSEAEKCEKWRRKVLAAVDSPSSSFSFGVLCAHIQRFQPNSFSRIPLHKEGTPERAQWAEGLAFGKQHLPGA